VSQAQAQVELTAISGDLERGHLDTNKNRAMFVRTELQARIARNPPDAMLIAMLSTLTLPVLFVACPNVAGRGPIVRTERLSIGAQTDVRRNLETVVDPIQALRPRIAQEILNRSSGREATPPRLDRRSGLWDRSVE
jgi:hypothetical protein